MPRTAVRITADEILCSQLFSDGISSTSASTNIGTNITPTPTTAIGTGAQTITIAELLTGVLEEDPEGAFTWTLPTAALLVAGLTDPVVGTTLDFNVINNASTTDDEPITLSTAETSVGSLVIENDQFLGEMNSGSAKFRIRVTEIISGSEAYTIYRLA